MQSEKPKAYKVGGHAELPASELTSWTSPHEVLKSWLINLNLKLS